MGDIELSRREILRRCGDASQLLGVKEYRLEGGRAAGVRAIDARNGSGLEFTVLPDRGMDIAALSLGGRNLSYAGSPGVVGPQYYDDRGLGWLRGFGAGFLTTCGLRNVGSPCEEGGESFGLHGRAAYAPAEAVSADVDWEGAAPSLRLSGRMREARVFGENLALSRRISAPCGKNALVLEDRVDNLGFREEALELLYHFNLGYPLLDAGAEFLAPSREVRPRDETARLGLAGWGRAEGPTKGYSEQVFYHELRSDGRGLTCVAFVNRAARLGVALRFDLKELPRLTQWKMMGEGEYVMGVEPCNCPVEGRARAREAGALEILEPGAHRRFRIEAEFLGDEAGIDRIAAEISRL